MHGALLDARILADVYLAMTGGQSALALEEAGYRNASRAASIELVSANLTLRVVAASADEREAHEQLQELLHAESRGRCLWRVQ